VREQFIGCGTLASILLCLFKFCKRIGEAVDQVVAELDDLSALGLDVRLVSFVGHLDHCCGLSRLLEHFLKVDLLQQKLVGFFGVEVVFGLDN